MYVFDWKVKHEEYHLGGVWLPDFVVYTVDDNPIYVEVKPFDDLTSFFREGVVQKIEKSVAAHNLVAPVPVLLLGNDIHKMWFSSDIWSRGFDNPDVLKIGEGWDLLEEWAVKSVIYKKAEYESLSKFIVGADALDQKWKMMIKNAKWHRDVGGGNRR